VYIAPNLTNPKTNLATIFAKHGFQKNQVVSLSVEQSASISIRLSPVLEDA
jgi:hypothetical protein